MADSTCTDLARPFFVIHVVWHPACAIGETIADSLMQHFRRDLYKNIVGGIGIPVVFRSACLPEASTPISISLEDSETSATVVILDENLVSSTEWLDYANLAYSQVRETSKSGFKRLFFPVAISREVLSKSSIAAQALRWDTWDGDNELRVQRLRSELTYEFCRILRYNLAQLEAPTERDLSEYLKKVQIFLSHSKHDDEGVEIAKAIRLRIYQGHGLSSFFDVHDIPAGLQFDEVLLHQVRVSAMVAIHTDSYSSREWCRKEIIEAKTWNVPLVVANSINTMDERGFPYMGNVPLVRLGHDLKDTARIDIVIGRLLDEVLRDFLWRCQTHEIKSNLPVRAIFIPRPPELISLSCIPDVFPDTPESTTQDLMLIYPDPPLSAEEERLLNRVAPHVQIRSLNEWKAGATR
ncbi:MAG: toll/interleukin-1 receptor domain-containing protein [Pseudomonas stutzeri]|uniref:TIR domain-containing protein n=1 Tax=Stutzerimonas stutzeri NF13 TaxID=1212548 RepID=M2TWW5_STUST|nr:toll/interleukin-1 receptor domain-containing protein [Stutzerimonas stutzeri]EME01861.1 hypothetical protein B381_01634 [Stutzerimonas stutzeri NF13]MBF6624463.1 toll/interleukin-1 receptor domain-containing protein [Stutzerimonas stutzeri]